MSSTSLHTHSQQNNNKRRRHRSGNDYGESWMVASALLEQPLTVDELGEYFQIMARRFGMFLHIFDRDVKAGDRHRNLQDFLVRNVEVLKKKQWIEEFDSRYSLTPLGREEANRMIEDMKRGGMILDKATHPETVAKVTMLIHFVLAAIKLPAALISGSVGLLNDALDTLMDGLSSLFVFLGVKRAKERLASYILLLFMTGTGLFTLYQAIFHMFKPAPLIPDVFTFLAVAASAVLCGVLWIYQKYAGLKHNCVPLIAQSVDSRNHIIVAGGVAAALIASLLHAPLLDHIVGIIVAVLILKGAIELFLDLVRSGSDGDIDLSRYGFQRFEKHRRDQCIRWLLYEIDKGRIDSRESIEREVRVATDFSRITSLKALGLSEQHSREEMIQDAVEQLFKEELVANPPLRLTEKGRRVLDKALSSPWRLSEDHTQFGSHPPIIHIIATVLSVTFSAGMFLAILIGGRFLLEFLPPVYTWSTYPAVLQGGAYSVTLPQLVCILSGFFLFYFGRRAIHKSRRTLSRKRVTRGEDVYPIELKTAGPYSKRRHPLYAGFVLSILGVAVSLGSGYLLGIAAIVVFVQLIAARREENRLLHRFEKKYQQYMEEVSVRMFPFPLWLLLSGVFISSVIGLWL